MAAAAAGVPVHRTTEVAFAKLAFGDRAEGLVAVIRPPSLDLADLLIPPDALIVVVEGVEKPGNVGAILRSADGAGASAVIAASPRTDMTNPNVIRASAGTVFALPLAEAAVDGARLAARPVAPVRRGPGGRPAALHRRRSHRRRGHRPGCGGPRADLGLGCR